VPEPSPPRSDEAYFRTHERRYRLLLELVRGLSPERILVVGPSHESVLLREVAPVDTLGWDDHRFPRVEGERHRQHDLNDPAYPELGPYDAVVCAEVVEHLHMPAESVVRPLAAALSPGGHLVLQTPNATSLPKRLRMLVGRNPYEPIRDQAGNPGHFHEYTLRELRDAVRAAGLDVEQIVTANYFDHGSPQNRLFRAVDRVLPPTLREGITVVGRPRR
jgi:methyltransferase family protein